MAFTWNKLRRGFGFSFRRQLLVGVVSLYSLFIVGLLTMVTLNHARMVREQISANKLWLSTYSESFLSDIELGSTLSVEKKLNYLLNRNLMSSAKLSFSGRMIVADKPFTDRVEKEDWIHTALLKILHPFYPSTDLKIDVKDSSGTVWGELEASLDPRFVHKPLVDTLCEILIYGFSIMLVLLGFVMQFLRYHLGEIHQLQDYLKQFSKLNYSPDQISNLLDRKLNITVDEWSDLYQEYLSAVRNIVSLQGKIKQNEIDIEIGKVTSQVAHDIRSPLAALNMIVKDLKGIPEESRTILRHAASRIRDIANNLLAAKKVVSAEQLRIGNLAFPLQKESYLISGLIELIVAEKRAQFKSREDVVIDAPFSDGNYGLFVKMPQQELSRVFSNLINNSVEAMPNGGTVQIVTGATDTTICVQISDNGIGIPEHLLNNIGERGKSFGKEGNGLGLAHARQAVEAAGGSLSIRSGLGKGTHLILNLPRVDGPSWFTADIKIYPEQTIVIADDDISIHELWDRRLRSYANTGTNINILHFNSPETLVDYILNSKDDCRGPILYLIDHEFVGSDFSGIDIIKKFSLERQAILVTSRFEESSIKNYCIDSKVKLIPKELASYVPMMYLEKSNHYYDTVLIDDDDLIAKTWELQAQQKGRSLFRCSSPKEFFIAMDTLPSHVAVYVDVNLGFGMQGDLIAKQIFDLGFPNIFIASGYDSNRFKDLKFLKGVVGKDPPWA